MTVLRRGSLPGGNKLTTIAALALIGVAVWGFSQIMSGEGETIRKAGPAAGVVQSEWTLEDELAAIRKYSAPRVADSVWTLEDELAAIRSGFAPKVAENEFTLEDELAAIRAGSGPKATETQPQSDVVPRIGRR